MQDLQWANIRKPHLWWQSSEPFIVCLQFELWTGWILAKDVIYLLIFRLFDCTDARMLQYYMLSLFVWDEDLKEQILSEHKASVQIAYSTIAVHVNPLCLVIQKCDDTVQSLVNRPWVCHIAISRGNSVLALPRADMQQKNLVWPPSLDGACLFHHLVEMAAYVFLLLAGMQLFI